VFKCVRGRERETKRGARERLRGMGGRYSGDGYMYERESKRDSGRDRERERGWEEG
jgi:hypothetical protein